MVRILLFDEAKNCWVEAAEPVGIVKASAISEVVSALQTIEETVNRKSLFAAGFVCYEAAPAFDPALKTHSPIGSLPLLLFVLFKRFGVSCLPESMHAPGICWLPSISRNDYTAAIQRIKRYIAAGDTYQVNFSFRMRAECQLSAEALFAQLVRAQPSKHAAFVETDDFAICSASPELFFQLDGHELLTRPMKGTRKRGLWSEQDIQLRDELRSSEKDRAENLMIVDMMRNDVGRVAHAGSVSVPSLFTIEQYPTVWQMTSSVRGETTASIAEIFKALFPCASVTGAPKARTMEIISELEESPRGIYTGAIGFMAPGRRARFSVAIRTVAIDKHNRQSEYGVGGGVVWASTPKGEYDECIAKAKILSEVRPSVELFETLAFSEDEGFFLGDEHIERLQSSARYFNLPFNEESVRSRLEEFARQLKAQGGERRVKLLLGPDGTAQFSISSMPQMTKEAVRVRLAAEPVNSGNLFLYHKTTHRAMYENALRAAGDCDDVILWNERGEITESTIANVVVEIEGKLYTPPVSCGLLNGTFRRRLLLEGGVLERVIPKAEVGATTRLYLINSLRRWREARLIH